jgi:hypothetical protein
VTSSMDPMIMAARHGFHRRAPARSGGVAPGHDPAVFAAQKTCRFRPIGTIDRSSWTTGNWENSGVRIV